jgi:hypothetical protein
VRVPDLTLDFLACRMSSSSGDGGKHRFSRLEEGKAIMYASSPDIDDEYESMEGPIERASRQVAEELQRHYDAGGEDMSSALGITIQEPVQPSALVGSIDAPTRGSSVAPQRASAMKRRKASEWISSTPEDDPEPVVPRIRYPLKGGIWPKR